VSWRVWNPRPTALESSDAPPNIRWRYRFGPGLSQSVRGVTLMRLRDGLIVEALACAKTGDASVAAPVRNAASSDSR